MSSATMSLVLMLAGTLCWSSNREDGRHELYCRDVDGEPGSERRMTHEGVWVPKMSPDGQLLAYTQLSNNTTHVVGLTGGDDREVCGEAFWFWMPRGHEVVCGDVVKGAYFRVDLESGKKTPYFRAGQFTRLEGELLTPWSIDITERFIATSGYLFSGGNEADNGTFSAPNGASYFVDLQNPDALWFLGAGCEPRFSSVDSSVVHVAGQGSPWGGYPDIASMDMQDLQSRSSYRAEVAYTDDDWGHEYFPTLSTDGKWLVYGASNGCHDHWSCDYELWRHRLGAPEDQRTRLTFNEHNDRWGNLHVPAGPDAPVDVDVELVELKVPPAADEPTSAGCSTATTRSAPSSALLVLLLALLNRGWNARRFFVMRRTSRGSRGGAHVTNSMKMMAALTVFLLLAAMGGCSSSSSEADAAADLQLEPDSESDTTEPDLQPDLAPDLPPDLPPDLAPDLEPDAAPGSKGLGQECVEQADCEEGLSCKEGQYTRRHCTVLCTSDEPCNAISPDVAGTCIPGVPDGVCAYFCGPMGGGKECPGDLECQAVICR